tara:strand:- start:52 stop:258 length:207 start_codon:yes stop_codon:yes gene_type:complete
MKLPPKLPIRGTDTVAETLVYGEWKWFCGLVFFLTRTGESCRDPALARRYAAKARERYADMARRREAA